VNEGGKIFGASESHSNQVTSIACHPSGSYYISGGSDGLLRVWHGDSNNLLMQLPARTRDVFDIAFFDGGRYFCTYGFSGYHSADSGSIFVWDAQTFSLVKAISPPYINASIASVASSGRALRVAYRGGQVFQLDANLEPQPLMSIGHAIDFYVTSQDESRAAAGDNLNISVYTSLGDTSPLVLKSANVSVVRLSTNGDRIAVGHRTGWITVWSTSRGNILKEYAPLPIASVVHGIKSLWFAHGDRALVSDGDVLSMYDLAVGRNQWLGIPERTTTSKLSSDGTKILQCGWRGKITTVQLSNGQIAHQACQFNERISEAVISRDGCTIAIAGTAGWIRVWNRAIGGFTAEMAVAHNQEVSALAISENGDLVLSGSWDGSVKLWDAGSGALVRSYNGLQGGTRALSISSDCAFVSAASWSKDIRRWELESGTEALTGAADDALLHANASSRIRLAGSSVEVLDDTASCADQRLVVLPGGKWAAIGRGRANFLGPPGCEEHLYLVAPETLQPSPLDRAEIRSRRSASIKDLL